MEVSESLVRVSPVTPAKLLRALRAFSLPASVLPVFVAVAAAVPAARWEWDVLLASAAGAALLHLGGNLLNDYFDFLNHVDRRTHDDDLRPGRLLVHRQLLPRDVLAEAGACLALALVAAAYLTWRCGAGIAWFGLAGLTGAYVYTGPPLKLKYRALGEAVIFLVFGPLLMLGAAWAQTGQLELAAFLASLPVGLATTAILVGNNVRDREEDLQAGIRTIGSFAGGKAARAAYLALVFTSAVGLAVLGACGAGPRGLLAAPLALGLIAKPASAVWKGRRIPDIDAQTARFEAVLLALAFAAYVVGW
jgi:1,4-dihydroxy-2-naphthoate polyprenyltransferase